MDRRDFLTISGAALAALAADWAAGSTAALTQARDGKPVDDRLVTMIEESARQLAGLAPEQSQHTAVLLDAHLTTVTELLEHGRPAPTVRLRLHALAASLSQTVAWNRFDLGRHTQASQYWIAGLHSANAMGTTTWAPAC